MEEYMRHHGKCWMSKVWLKDYYQLPSFSEAGNKCIRTEILFNVNDMG